MTELGHLIREARERRHWSTKRLGAEAQKLPGAPPNVDYYCEVRKWETTRLTLDLAEPRSALPFILAALGLTDPQICKALGLGSGRRAA